jgi:hypothetical protein
MKTKKLIIAIFAIFAFATTNKLEAQNYPFTNNLSCDVQIGYEMFDIIGCPVVSFGTFYVQAGNTYALPLVNSTDVICIWIIDIDGCSVPTNHVNTGGCHSITPFGQSGTMSAGCCSGSAWAVTCTSTSWQIN